MKTLYVSDLDGTLLRSDMSMSEETIRTINQLIGEGMLFTYATARSIHSSAPLTEALHLMLPVITHNGCFLVDPHTQAQELIGSFSDPEVFLLKQAASRFGSYPMVNALLDESHRLSYVEGEMSAPLQAFIDSKHGESRMRASADTEGLFSGLVYYATFIDESDTIRLIYEELQGSDCFELHFQKDIYSGEQWLEVMPRTVSKAAAILRLKDRLGVDRVVVFGDAINDLQMFEVADEGYAMENAIEALKQCATAVIAGNQEDGVARQLLLLARKKRP